MVHSESIFLYLFYWQWLPFRGRTSIRSGYSSGSTPGTQYGGWSSEFMSETLNIQATVPDLNLPWLEFRKHPRNPIHIGWSSDIIPGALNKCRQEVRAKKTSSCRKICPRQSLCQKYKVGPGNQSELSCAGTLDSWFRGPVRVPEL